MEVKISTYKLQNFVTHVLSIVVLLLCGSNIFHQTFKPCLCGIDLCSCGTAGRDIKNANVISLSFIVFICHALNMLMHYVVHNYIIRCPSHCRRYNRLLAIIRHLFL